MIVPEQAVLRASQWCYQGIWGFITGWLLVPEHPPELRSGDDADVRSFRPANGFLRYLKFFFWIGLVAFDGVLFVGWIALLIAVPWLGILLAIPIWAIMIIPDIVAYIAIHLRYDTTWYVLSDRSMRIRRGIWIIHETTITYDNIQNVSIRQGPLQNYFGISDVLVETAGGGAMAGKGDGASVLGHSGLLEGVDNAEEIRTLILAKWNESKSAGLGDEPRSDFTPTTRDAFGERQVELLESIKDLAERLVKN
ncbi:MAG: PH domain-containing protein [Planctomycetota bacterium]